MRKVRRISLIFMLSAVSYLGGIYTQTLYHTFYPNRSENVELSEEFSDTENIQPAVVNDSDTTTCDTKFHTISYDESTGDSQEEESSIPAKYIGMTRQELEEAVIDYNLSPPLTELNLGMTRAELVSFSPQKVVLRKTYDLPVPEDGFVLVAERNYITVYYKDLKSVYLYTDIRMDQLPQDIQGEIIARKYVEDESELYNFLESYSS